MKSRWIRAGLILWCVLGMDGLATASGHALIKVSGRMVVVSTAEPGSATTQQGAPAATSAVQRSKRSQTSTSPRAAAAYMGIDHYQSDRLPPIQAGAARN